MYHQVFWACDEIASVQQIEDLNVDYTKRGLEFRFFFFFFSLKCSSWFTVRIVWARMANNDNNDNKFIRVPMCNPTTQCEGYLQERGLREFVTRIIHRWRCAHEIPRGVGTSERDRSVHEPIDDDAQ